MKEKVLNFRFIFYPFLAFFFGITIARSLYSGSLEAILLSICLIGVLCGFLIFKKLYKILAIILAFFFLGNGFYFIGEATFKSKDYSSVVSVVGRVSEDVIDYGYSVEIVLDDVKINGKSEENLRLTLKNAKNSFDIGDKVAFEGKVENSKLFTLKSFNSADLRDGVRYHAEVDFNDVVFTKGFIKLDEKVRLAVKHQLYVHMSEKNAGICYAVLFGDKSGVDEATENAYQNSGIIHVLTVSGLHVGFLIALVYFLLKLCRANRYVQFLITTIFIIFYAYLCGFSPSVVRAGVMAIVLMLSKIVMRRYDNLNSLGIAGFALCLFSPLTALDIGFQMSFFCVATIFVLSPSLTKILSKILPNKIASLIALSFSAQIGILPFLATFSAQINFLSVIANLLVVPLFSIIYPYLFLVGFLATFMPFVGYLLKLVDVVFVAINGLANFFAGNGLTYRLSPFKTSFTALYFILIMAIGKFVMRKPLVKFAMFSVITFVMTLTFGLFLIPSRNENVIYFVGNSASSSVIIENEKGGRVVIGESFMLSRFVTAYGINKIDGFIAVDYLTNDKMENLAGYGVELFIGNEQNAENKNFYIFKDNKSYMVDEFNVQYVSGGGKLYGVNVSFADYDIFVATRTDFDYNDSVIKSLSPNILFVPYGIGRSDAMIVSQIHGNDSDYALTYNGNMKIKRNGEKWIVRGID